MEANKTLLIADDHALIRQGLRHILDSETPFRILEAEDGEKALKIIREHKPDIAILDVEMPFVTGFEVAKKVHKEGLNLDVIFLTMYKDEAMFNNAMDIGVKGYVLKENTVTEILECLKAVLAGRHYLSPAISELLIRRNSKLSAPASDSSGLHLLTHSESTILKMLSEMKTNNEIADELGISIKTVQNHRNNICGKLGLSGAHALLKFAIERAPLL